MLCYKDRTYCPFDKCAKFEECHRALAEDVAVGSALTGLPICQFAEEPECFEKADGEE